MKFFKLDPNPRTKRSSSRNRTTKRRLGIQPLDERLLMFADFSRPFFGDTNDQIGEALLISTGMTSGEITAPPDVDLHAIALNAGDTISIDIDSPNELYGLLRVFDESGTELANSNGEPTPGPGDELSYLEPYMTFEATSTDTFYIGVSTLSNDAYNPVFGTDNASSIDEVGSYDLKVDLVPFNRVFFVNTVGDLGDARPGDGVAADIHGNTSLRAAIEEANALGDANHFLQIEFDLPVTELDPSTLTYIIEPITPLPAIEHGLTLNSEQLSTSVGSDYIRIDGSQVSGNDTDGLLVTGSGVELNWIEVTNFPGEGVQFDGTHYSTLKDSLVSDNGANGVLLNETVDSFVLGSDIFRNDLAGIQITGADSQRNTVSRNNIGLFETGLGILGRAGNVGDGVEVVSPLNDISHNTIGMNQGNGIAVTSATAEGNTVAGNDIGVVNNIRVPNELNGILLESPNNQLFGNLVSGNGLSGLLIDGPAANNNTIYDSLFGTNDVGQLSIPNGAHGIEIVDADDSVIGDHGFINVISGNTLSGISVSGSTGTVIDGNHIGTTENALGELPNGDAGVELILGSSLNQISNNHIAGNVSHQVRVVDQGSDENTFTSNLIGVGVADIEIHGGDVAVLVETTGNIFGDELGLDRNIIAGSDIAFEFSGTDARENVISGNDIGTAHDPVDGWKQFDVMTNVLFTAGASENTLGPFNVIGFASQDAVEVEDSAGTGNTITRNQYVANALEIDLGINGLDINDAGDVDVGPNQLQNTPVVASANLVPTTAGGLIDIRIHYSVDSDPNDAAYPLTTEFYLEDPTSGEGKRYSGTDTYTIDDFTVGSKTVSLIAISTSDVELSATVTDANGNTSEFTVPIALSNTLNPPTTPPGGSSILPVNASRLDVDGNGVISPLDALLVINALTSEVEATQDSLLNFDALDTNADGTLSALDALLVVNKLIGESETQIDAPGQTPVDSEPTTPFDRDEQLDLWDDAFLDLADSGLF